jgi:hypothetical protein
MRQPIRLPELTPDAIEELDALYRTTHEVRLRTRVQMILLAAEQHLVASQIAKIVRTDPDTVVAWLTRHAPAVRARSRRSTEKSWCRLCANGRAVWTNPTRCGRSSAWLTI